MISFLLSGCASPYAKFYTENNYASSLYKENNKDLVFLADGETPIVYTTDNIDRDVKIMKSKNYVPIGSSSFNGELEDEASVINYAKKIKAIAVLYASKYTNTQTNSGALLLPQTNNFSGTISGSNGFSTFNGSSTGMAVTPYSLSQSRYDQSAVFFIKSLKKWKIGVLFSDITRDIKILIRHSGVLVDNIIVDTPAYKSNLLIGDIVIEVNNMQITDSKNLMKILGDTYVKGGYSDWKVIRNNKEEIIRINF